MSKVAIMGYGTIGSGVLAVLMMNRELIKRSAGDYIDAKYVLDLKDFPGTPAEKLITHDIEDIVKDPEVDIVVETMGGTNPAYPFVKKRIEAGKSVCTSNKELVEKHGQELLELAKAKDVDFLFEASCGGGIPVIRALNCAYVADEIEEISGILNGTTNFILTKMLKEGAAYADVLKEAQDMGIAERNPEADVEGHDPCRKIAILASVAYGKNVNFESIYTEGITGITPCDMEFAKKRGGAIKLIASFREKEGKYYAMVSPFFVSEDNALCAVNGAYNAIYIKGNAVGSTMLYGSGAGMMETASAVVADVVNASRGTGETKRVVWLPETLKIEGIDEDKRSFMVCVNNDKAASAKEAFGATESVELSGGVTGLITKEMTEKEFKASADSVGIVSRIRIK